MRILLLRPPRYLWPFNSETSAFWQPLGLLSLAGAVRRAMPGAEVEVWDAPAVQMGWRSLERRLRERPVDVLGVGEETVSAHEALRAVRLVKDLHPNCVAVAGGLYFPYALDQAFDGGVDVVVRGEGEATFVELLDHARDRAAWRAIPGIAFRENGETVLTPARPLIADLDNLPMPAWDLIDMDAYGRGSRNHPGLVSIEHSRGCIDSCAFCILWKHMGRESESGVASCYRSKSPRRGYEEVEHLYRRFGRRTFGWVDPTFNASPRWSDEWAGLMLRSPLCPPGREPLTTHTAWMRADCLVRDHGLGVMDKLVRAGLRQVMIGVERGDAGDLASLGKHHNGPEVTREAFAILRRHYPQVYSIGSVIFGLPGDSLGSVRRLMRWADGLDMDYCFPIPLTPNPGAGLTRELEQRGYVGNGDRASYNFHTPVCRTDALALRELDAMYWRLFFRPDAGRLRWLSRALFPVGDARKRRVSRALLAKGAGIALRSLLHGLVRPGDPQPTLFSRRPSWYDA